MNLLNISGSPHVHSDESTKKIMWRVNAALVPALLCAIAYFGINALLVSIVSVLACVLFQWLIEKFIMKVPSTVCDGSAIVTGLLLAFNVPATVDMLWIVVIGALVAIGIGKMSFGGLGKNPFNPALVGRVFMLVSFPTAMTTWPQAAPIFDKGFFADAVTGPTPLGILKEAGVGSLAETGNLQFLDMVLGNRGGAFGEVCAIALLLGAIYLICRKVIEIFTPLSILLTVFVFTGICYLIDPTQYIAPTYHLVYGGLILGAFFMATDMVTSPMTIRGKLLFGFGIGVITVVIRLWGAYPEGVSFAILIMNAFTPLINKAFKPKVFGVVKPSKN